MVKHWEKNEEWDIVLEYMCKCTTNRVNSTGQGDTTTSTSFPKYYVYSATAKLRVPGETIAEASVESGRGFAYVDGRTHMIIMMDPDNERQESGGYAHPSPPRGR